MSDEHHVPHAVEAITLMADGLAQPALYAVAVHGVAHLAADGDADPRFGTGSRQEDAEQDALPNLPTPPLDPAVIASEPDPVPLGQAESGLGRVIRRGWGRHR